MLVLCVLAAACGGEVETAPGSYPLPPDTAPEVGPRADADADADANTGWHFVCQLTPAPGEVVNEECTTLPDGGPSYTDTQGDVDCRSYLAGAGQGCIAPMSCQAWLGGELVQGTCVNRP